MSLICDEGYVRCSNERIDVVVPLPLPLSAILILVIGKSDCSSHDEKYTSNNMIILSIDLGFELCVAVCV